LWIMEILLRPGGVEDTAGCCLLGRDDVDDRESIGIDDNDPAVRKEEEAVAFVCRYDLHDTRR